MEAWIGVDLDGTLAHYDGWQGVEHIGEPIEPMLDRVKEWLAGGMKVKIMTARASEPDFTKRQLAITFIRQWCKKHIGQDLEVVCCKDFGMIELWDDRAVQVEKNTGRRATL